MEPNGFAGLVEVRDAVHREDAEKEAFRKELDQLQGDLRNYTRLLAELVGVEDLTDLEDV
jgi:hypothetical protein